MNFFKPASEADLSNRPNASCPKSRNCLNRDSRCGECVNLNLHWKDATIYDYDPSNCPEHRWCKFFLNITPAPPGYVPTQSCMNCGTTRPITEDPHKDKMVYLSKDGWKYEDG